MLLPPLTPAILLRRYKRFLADVRFADGSEAVCHVPNPGTMLGLAHAGLPVWLSRARPGRKLDWSMHLVEVEGALVGIDTSLPNTLAQEAIVSGTIPELAGYTRLRREVPYGQSSRIDIVLERDGAPAAYVEVKNVHLRRTPGLAEFPDCTAARSTKHMHELMGMHAQGSRAVALFVVQREDCHRFSPAADLDPAFASAYGQAKAAGVEILVYACAMSLTAIHIAQRIA